MRHDAPVRAGQAGEQGSGIWRRLQAALARETSGGTVITQVDGLRFVAIMAVLLYHLEVYVVADTPQTPPGADLLSSGLHRLLACGYFGVQLFFVISGFVLGLPFARAQRGDGRPVQLRRYYLRRVTRLEPPYIISIVALTVPLLLLRGMDPKVLESAGASLVYSHYFFFGQPSWIDNVAWSLEVEVQFYILAPLLATVFRVHSSTWRRGILAAAIVAAGAGQALSPQGLAQGYTIANQLQYFLTGFLLADLYACGWFADAGPSWTWDALGVGAWLGMIAMLVVHVGEKPHPFDGAVATVMPPLLFVAFAAALRGRVWSRVLGVPGVYLVGGMCYTIYLWHRPLLAVFGPLVVPYLRFRYYWANDVAALVVLVPLILAASAVLFVAFEKPFMRRDWPARLRQRLLMRLRPTLVAAPEPEGEAA